MLTAEAMSESTKCAIGISLGVLPQIPFPYACRKRMSLTRPVGDGGRPTSRVGRLGPPRRLSCRRFPPTCSSLRDHASPVAMTFSEVPDRKLRMLSAVTSRMRSIASRLGALEQSNDRQGHSGAVRLGHVPEIFEIVQRIHQRVGARQLR